MAKQVVALNNKVIVQVEPGETVTEGGIIIEGASLNGSLRKGKIVSVGPKVTLTEHGVKVGDIVAFHKGHGEPVEGREDVQVVPALELRYVLEG